MAQQMKWWEKEELPETVWRACVSDEGLDYYYNTESGRTTWDKPEELMTEEELNSQGEFLWVPDKEEVFVQAKVRTTMGKKHQVEYNDGSTGTVLKKRCMPFQRASLKRIVQDLTLLDDMSVPLILHNLRERFESQSKIYTNIGTILIAVNPYTDLGLYTREHLRKYRARTVGESLPPHIFATASDAFYGVKAFGKLQSIVVSGESGAGKTEATKQCLQFLAAVAGSSTGIENKILKANPVLEAFGNAKTLRNDNSSRFGKFIEVFFNDDHRIVSGATKNYLLEKVRVVKGSPNERNFHIFYQLLRGGSSALHTRLHLLSDQPGDYAYLKCCTDVPTLDDAKDFKEVQEAFKELEFTEKETDGLFAVVSAVLALGNVTFRETKRGDESEVDPSSRRFLSAAAANLGVTEEVLGKALVTRALRVRMEVTMCALDVKKASDSRDALCKFAYARMFDWLVQRVNVSMGVGGAKGSRRHNLYIGILDIFGFEIFKSNSFEQLCINYTNEMLQQFFNANTFKLEEKIYRDEGIQFDHVDFIDNQPMIDLITKRPHGVLAMLDEELRVPRGNDVNFCTKLVETHRSNAVFGAPRFKGCKFSIVHYAGTVEYNVHGFLEKNRDTLTEDLVDMLRTSSNTFVNKLYPRAMEVTRAERKASLGKQFQHQLSDLMGQLHRTEPHYVRCIKPNEHKSKLSFSPRMCYEQLTYSGVFEAVAIRKQGFPFRLTHEGFAERYGKVLREPASPGEIRKNARAICKKVVSEMKLDKTNVRFGKSRVLYRAMEYRVLELEWSIKTKNETIRSRLETLTSRSADSMSEREKEDFIISLATAVRDADLFKINTPAAQRGRAMMERFIEDRMDPETKRRLKTVQRSKDRVELEELLDHCDRQGYVTRAVRACRELLEKIVDADAALAFAMKDQSAEKVEYLAKALEMCDAFDYCVASVEKARQLLQDINKANAGLKKALHKKKAFKHKLLEKVVSFCNEIAYSSPKVQRAIILLQRIKAVRKLLVKAWKAVDQTKLEEALAVCDTKNFDGRKYRARIVTECREVLERIVLIKKEAKKAEKQLIPSQVDCVITAADQIELKTERIEKLRKLSSGSKTEYLRAQIAAAKKCGDHVRAVRVSCKLKDLFVKKRGQKKLAWQNYRNLKAAENWAKEKWFFRKHAEENMLVYQESCIHSPLTTNVEQLEDLDERKDLTAKVLNNFETIQKLMSQRNSTKIPLRIHQLLTSCIAHIELRDEAYLGFMKQCTGNSDGDMVISLAFKAIALCLTTFPPTKQLSDHLACFLRGEEHKRYSEAYKCKFLLSRILYQGSAKPEGLPDQDEYKIHLETDGRRYTGGSLKEVLPQRLKLDEFDKPRYNRDNASWLALRIRRSSICEVQGSIKEAATM